MDKIYYDGNLKASLTVGSVNGIGGISEEQLEEALSTKADINHTHDEYLTQHQDISHLALKSEIPSIEGLASEEYVNNKFDSIEIPEVDLTGYATEEYVNNQIDAIPEVDLSNCATKEELQTVNNEISNLKTSVSNGKTLLASAITDKGVNTLATDSFETMANNVSQITTGDGPVYENPDFYELRTKGGTDYSYLFSYCYNSIIDNSGMDKWDTSNVTDMHGMFYYCSELTSLDVSNFNTSNVKSMRDMFNECSSLSSLDLFNFNTSKVTTMERMFNGCSSLTSLDLSNFNTSNVTSMRDMFNECSSLSSLDLSNFDTSNVTDMKDMFQGAYGDKCIERLIIPNWDMTKVTKSSTTRIFGTSASYTTNLKYIDISNTDSGTLTKVKNALFAKTETTYGEIIIPIDTSQELIDALIAKYWRPVKKDNSLIFDYTSLEIYSALDEIVGIGKKSKLYFSGSPWYATKEDVEFVSSDESIAYVNEDNELISVSYGSVDIYARMKSNNSIVSNTLTINISETDSYPNVIKFVGGTTSPGTNHYIIVNGNNIKLTDMDYNSTTNIYTYDAGAPITTVIFNGYSYSNTTTTNPVGYDNISELIKINTSNITSMRSMFRQCGKITSLDVSNFDTSNVTNMSYMFRDCTALTTVNLSNWNTSNVTNMSSMFGSSASSFIVTPIENIIGVNSLDTSNVTNMSYMFEDCPNLTSLDLSNWNTSNVTNMKSMFDCCESLTSLDLSNFNTSNVTLFDNIYRAFYKVPTTVDWHYDGTNYQNFTLTESQTAFSGTFPWNLEE